MAPPDVKAQLLRTRVAADQTWLRTDGRSMGRRWRPGSTVLLSTVDGDAHPGEVWAFYTAEGDMMVHRCIAVTGDLVTFRGDARVRADAPVPASWLVGRVICVDDGLRRWAPRRRHALIARVRTIASALRRRVRRRWQRSSSC